MRFGDYAPQNFDHRFHGELTAREALQLSLNLPAVALLSRVGPLRFAGLFRDVGLPLHLPDPGQAPGLPIVLGGVGTSLEDLVTLYAGIAAGGSIRPLRLTPADPLGTPRKFMSPGRRLVPDTDPERDPAAAELARRHQPRPRPAGRLQDRHLLWLPRRLGHRLYGGLHRRRLGRPPRWQLLARTHGARGGGTHPLRRLRSAPYPPDRACAAARGRAGGDQCRAPRHAALLRCPADAGPAARLQRGQGRAGDRLSCRWFDHRAGSPGPGAEEPAARCRWRRLAAALAGERQAHRTRRPSAARRNGSPTGPARCALP